MAEELLDIKQLKILFAKLLGSKSAWVPFTEHVWKMDGVKQHNNDLNVLFEKDPEEWLQVAFPWDDTSEGYGFWESLNSRWIDILEMNDKEYEAPDKWKKWS